MNIIGKPENNGDLHIKLLLQESQNYAINSNLVEHFLKAFYTILWSNAELKDKLFLEVLTGDHKEGAFVEIKTDIDCLKEN